MQGNYFIKNIFFFYWKIFLEIEIYCYYKCCNWFSNNVINVNFRCGIMCGLVNFVDIFFLLKIRNDDIFDL